MNEYTSLQKSSAFIFSLLILAVIEIVLRQN